MIACKSCGIQLPDTAATCPHCGRVQGEKDSDLTKYLLPTGRSSWAIASGYLGLISILLVPAPAALFCGVMALRDIGKNQEKSGIPRAMFGIVLGALGTVGLIMAFR
jgi:hypothetical protein